MVKYTINDQIHPNYTNFLSFESDFNSRIWYNYFLKNFHYNYIACILYVIIIFSGKHLMEKRTALKASGLLFVWNLSLCLFSMFGFVRMFAEIPLLLSHYKDLKCTICIPQLEIGPSAFWQVMFTLSKFVEFGDTFLLVVRKKPVIFLHWYHHVSVLLFTMHVVTRFNPIGRWMATINYGVHMIMYGYYTLTAIGIRLPKILSASITSLQLIQMFAGLSVAIMSIAYCDRTDNSSAYWGILVYTSYAILFGNFFYNSYIASKSGDRKNHQLTDKNMAKVVDSNGNYVNGFKTKQG